MDRSTDRSTGRLKVRKLVLACPAGLRVQGINSADLFTIPAEQLLSYLVSDPKTLKKMSEVVPTNEMKVGRYRKRPRWHESSGKRLRPQIGSRADAHPCGYADLVGRTRPHIACGTGQALGQSYSAGDGKDIPGSRPSSVCRK